jgi:hypothetical protein
MKKIYLTILSGALITITASVFAQGNPQQAPGVSISPAGAGPGDEITLTIDASFICNPDGKDSLVGKTEAGFHAGYIGTDSNAWQSVVNFDAAGAISLTSSGDNVFSATFTPSDYFGAAAADMIGFSFVLNGGVNGGGWDVEGKAYNANNECSDFFVYLPYVWPTGINPIENIADFSVMPNPATSNTNFAFTTKSSEKVSLKLYSLLGAEVATVVNGNLAAGTYNQEIALDNLSNGVYMYVLRAGDSVTQGKIVKQ